MKQNYSLNVRQKLCVTLSLVIFCVAQALAVTKDVTVGDFKLRLDTDTKEAVVLSNGLGAYSGDVVIPSVVEDNGVEYQVVELPSGLFYNCTDLTSVQLPKNLRKIGKQCFLSCRSLTELEIPSTLKEVGDGCFNGCKGLLTLDFSSTSISELPKECFYGCSGLRIIKLPASLSVIGSSVFSSCEKIDDIVLPNAVTGLGNECFYSCASLTSIDIPASVKSINDRCFKNCI